MTGYTQSREGIRQLWKNMWIAVFIHTNLQADHWSMSALNELCQLAGAMSLVPLHAEVSESASVANCV